MWGVLSYDIETYELQRQPIVFFFLECNFVAIKFNLNI